MRIRDCSESARCSTDAHRPRTIGFRCRKHEDGRWPLGQILSGLVSDFAGANDKRSLVDRLLSFCWIINPRNFRQTDLCHAHHVTGVKQLVCRAPSPASAVIKSCTLVLYDGWLWLRHAHPISPPSRPGGPFGNLLSPIADPR